MFLKELLILVLDTVLFLSFWLSFWLSLELCSQWCSLWSGHKIESGIKSPPIPVKFQSVRNCPTTLRLCACVCVCGGGWSLVTWYWVGVARHFLTNSLRVEKSIQAGFQTLQHAPPQVCSSCLCTLIWMASLTPLLNQLGSWSRIFLL